MDKSRQTVRLRSKYAPVDAVTEQRHVLEYLPLVKRIVRQLLQQTCGSMAREDMEQIGLMGLLEALRRYGQRDEAFPAYAATRIRGAILDELRRHDWRPRTVRQETHRVRDMERSMRRELGREPLAEEISAALGMSVTEYHRNLIATNAEMMASFDEVLESDALIDSESPENQVVRRRSLAQALAHLDVRGQRVIQLYYQFDLNLREIAEVLGLTEARICQINKAALRKMRSVLIAP